MADIEAGKAIYTATCFACHGATGKGDGPAATALKSANPPVTVGDLKASTLTDADLQRIISGGGPALQKSPVMPANPSVVGTALDNLVAYIKTFR